MHIFVSVLPMSPINIIKKPFALLENLTVSLSKMTKINCILVKKLLSFYYKKKARLKLPNDILINKKKICGILQEKIQNKEASYLIVGIGLNLIKSPKIKGYLTTNLYDLTQTKVNVNKISMDLKRIYENFLIKQKVS